MIIFNKVRCNVCMYTEEICKQLYFKIIKQKITFFIFLLILLKFIDLNIYQITDVFVCINIF